MRLEPDQITEALGAMLAKAGRPDLIANGFEIDDETLARSLAISHNSETAIYHALFDRGAPHAGTIKPATEAATNDATDARRLLAAVEESTLQAGEHARTAGALQTVLREGVADVASQLVSFRSEFKEGRSEFKEADEADECARVAAADLAEMRAAKRARGAAFERRIQIAILLAVLVALFATRAHGQSIVSPVTTASTGASALTSFLSSAASTNATSVKASAGNVYTIRAVNTTATLYYLRMYNLATAPTCSSATGYVETIPVPASATGAGIAITQYPQGYTAGIAYCLTGGGASTDTSNAATGVYVTVLYK